MQELVKLIEITRKKGQRSIQLVNQNFRKKEVSKDNLLYEGILEGNFTSDEAASQSMFNADPGNRNYRNAKSKLKQKLLNHLYFLDYEKNSYSLYEKTEYNTRHALHQARILINEGASDIALRILAQVIKDARQYEFVELLVEALEITRMEYAQLGKSTPFLETQAELEKARQLHEAIYESEDRYFSALVYINKSISAQNRILTKLPEYVKFIEQRAKKYNSTRLDILSNRLRLLELRLRWKFNEVVNLCKELEHKYLNGNMQDVSVGLDKKEIAFHRLYAYFYLKNVDEGAQYAEKKLGLFKEGNTEWFNFIEYYFLLLMQCERYKKAGELFRKIRTNKNYTNLEEVQKDRWQIYRAYLVFVNDSKLLKWGFDLEAFLQQLPAFSKDDQGLNIATLVIQFLYLLREGQVEEVIRRVEEIQQYSSVHLDKRHNYRNSIFIRMMTIVTDKEFDYELVQEKGQNYYRKLVRSQIPSNLQSDLEVISFEVLWNYVLDILKTNKRYVHYRFYHIEAVGQR